MNFNLILYLLLMNREKEADIPMNLVNENENVNDNDNEVHQAVAVSFGFSMSTQVNLMDTRKERCSDEGFTFADILSNASGCNKCTQFNSLPLYEDEDSSPNVTLPELLSSKEKLFTFTGIHSLELLDTLVECVEDVTPDSSTSKKKMLSLKDRVLLTMVKIKQNMTFTAIGVLFGINRQTCSNYFRNMCPVLSLILKAVIPWPDQSLIRCNLPISFKKFRDTRIVMDCCEVSVEKCKCLKCRVLTYSQYKKDHTIKFNMGVAPSGLITEISPAFGGRASDKLIVSDSKILDKLDYKDAVMVDKGYMIEQECEQVGHCWKQVMVVQPSGFSYNFCFPLQRNLKLIRPPFLAKSKNYQLSREEALRGAEVARARVHVERVFQRMREYEMIIGPVPWELVPYFEDCLTIVAALTNLGPPIMNIDKFM